MVKGCEIVNDVTIEDATEMDLMSYEKLISDGNGIAVTEEKYLLFFFT